MGDTCHFSKALNTCLNCTLHLRCIGCVGGCSEGALSKFVGEFGEPRSIARCKNNA
jgi:hypothetical protein